MYAEYEDDAEDELKDDDDDAEEGMTNGKCDLEDDESLLKDWRELNSAEGVGGKDDKAWVDERLSKRG